MVAAARLNRRITIQNKAESRSATGDITEVWTDLGTVWAEKRDLRGGETYAAQSLIEMGDVIFVIRYLSGITTESRIVCDGQNYDVTREPMRIGGKTRYLEVAAKRGVRDGR